MNPASGDQDGVMSEADDAAAWLRIMDERYDWGEDLAGQMVKAEAVGQCSRELTQCEQLWFEGKLAYRHRD